MNKNLAITSFLGLTAIIVGAFATHGFQEVLTTQQMNSLQTGIQFHIYHVIVLLFVNSYKGFSNRFKNKVSILFYAGILCFSGSIYAIYMIGVSVKNSWFVTPLGGLFLIIGWLLMTGFFLKKTINK